MKAGKVLPLASLDTNIVLSHYFVAYEMQCFSRWIRVSKSKSFKIQTIMSWQVVSVDFILILVLLGNS